MKQQSHISAENVGALILAGGESNRMGFPKPWLSFDAQSSYLKHIIQLYSEVGVAEIVTVINTDFCRNEWAGRVQGVQKATKVVGNSHPESGRLYSIQLGLKEMKADNIFIHNVDSPFVGEELIRELWTNRCGNGISIPVTDRRKGHPVLISKEVKIRIISDHYTFNTLRNVFELFDRRLVETSDKGILINVNTEEQYQESKSGHIQ